MDTLKKHYETLMILGGMASLLIASCIWINNQFRTVDRQFSEVQKEIGLLKSDMAVIKTILIMKDIMPKELATKEIK